MLTIHRGSEVPLDDPVKIGLITHYMPPHNGGIERVAQMLFSAYTCRGNSVRWVASRDPIGAPRREGERIRVSCWNGLERRWGVPVPLWGPTAWREVQKLAQWADVLHVHDCLYPGSVLAVGLGEGDLAKPVVLSQHVGFIQYRRAALRIIQQVAYATLGRWVLRRACRLVFATPAAEAYVTELLGGYPPHACSIPNGIDTDRFHPADPLERQVARKELGLLDQKPVVLFVGRLVEKKGVDLVVEASRRLPDLHFLVVGDGPLAGSLPAAANVTWHRGVRPERIHECYHASDCFFLPSHGEGLPIVVQEAAASGLPMLVSEGEAYSRQLLDKGVCVTAPRTASAMTAALRELLSGPVEVLGARARRVAASEWSMTVAANRYCALLEEAVAEQPMVREHVKAT